MRRTSRRCPSEKISFCHITGATPGIGERRAEYHASDAGGFVGGRVRATRADMRIVNDERDHLQSGRQQKRRRISILTDEITAGERPEHEPRAERRADVGERAPAFLGLDEIRDVRLRDADVAPGKALDDAREKDDPDRGSKRQHGPPDRRADLRDDQDAFAADAVADVAPDRSTDELAERKRCEEGTDHDVGRAEMLHIIGHQRNQNTESEDVDERDAEDRQQLDDHAEKSPFSSRLVGFRVTYALNMANTGAVSAARPVALITGASAGIGYEFAMRLAERGYDLILTARRRDRLDELAAKILSLHGVRVEAIAADLSDATAVPAIAAEIEKCGMAVDLLVNNAGFGTHGRFETLQPERERNEVAVNVVSLVALTHAFLPGMLERRSGGVINVASTAAFQPVPFMAVYGATKAFVRSFSEALHEEVHARGVRVLALCPGPTATDFFDEVAAVPGPMRTARDVVTTALKAYDAGVPTVIDGASNKLMVAGSSLLPRRWVTRIGAQIMRPRP